MDKFLHVTKDDQSMHIGDNMELKYTKEKNVLILISLLKKFGIKRIIVSPGTTNFTFVGSIQNDSFFEIYSAADERSAAYMACGMAAETDEPIVITCTGATASRNYFPALTEAYYRKLPILAVMAHCGVDFIGNLKPQQIDRRISPSDTFVEKVTLNPINTYRDEQYTILQTNKALLALREKSGPVQLELVTNFNKDFSIQSLPDVRKITVYNNYETFPDLPNGSIYIVIGSHKCFSKAEINAIDSFCDSHNAIVLCDHTSNYKGKYGYNLGLLFSQKKVILDCKKCDLAIHIGEISGNYYGMQFSPNNVWRVSEDGEVKDFFSKLTSVFAINEQKFFEIYSTKNTVTNTIKKEIKEIKESVYKLIPELPFSNIWVAKNTIGCLPKGSVIHLGILNSLRAWDYFQLDNSITAFSNVGGFGIDGGVSTCLGASLMRPNKLFFCAIGDLAFFYDMNALGNRYLPHNIRILLFNNGSGTEFRNYNHPAHDVFGDAADPYMAAAGHYGNKSSALVKHYAEDLGFKYISASNKEQYLQNLPVFVDPEIGEKPVLFEVFTDSKDESNALETMFNLVESEDGDSTSHDRMTAFKDRAKNAIKSRYNSALDRLKL